MSQKELQLFSSGSPPLKSGHNEVEVRIPMSLVESSILQTGLSGSIFHRFIPLGFPIAFTKPPRWLRKGAFVPHH